MKEKLKTILRFIFCSLILVGSLWILKDIPEWGIEKFCNVPPGQNRLFLPALILIDGFLFVSGILILKWRNIIITPLGLAILFLLLQWTESAVYWSAFLIIIINTIVIGILTSKDWIAAIKYAICTTMSTWLGVMFFALYLLVTHH